MPQEPRDYDRVELVWPGKRAEVERVRLPFQTIERVNDVRASGTTPDGMQGGLLTTTSQLPEWWPEGWRNRLIWGDNKYVLASLLDEFAGKFDLVYIDPPFATGSDFSFRTTIGDSEVEKLPSAIEEVAYRDTWGRGLASYFDRLHGALTLARDLMSPDGHLFVHLGGNIAGFARPILSEIFGDERFTNEIVWKRSAAHSDTRQGAKHLGRVHDVIFWYRMSSRSPVEMAFTGYDEDYVRKFYKHVDATGRRYMLDNTSGPGGARKGNPYYEFRGVTKYWRYSRERIEQLYQEGRLEQSKSGGDWRYKRYLDEMPGVALQDVWSDIAPLQSQSAEGVGYDTQKPSELVARIIRLASAEGGLVLDFYGGSGTTAVAAEGLGRRWVTADLGRFAIQTTRKRLLSLPGCRPFEVQNLGRYERRYWQGLNAGETVWEYHRFVLDLYQAQPISGFTQLHGQKAGRFVHVGATDAPVTVDEVARTLEECAANKLTNVDILGWEWEMGLNPAGKDDLASKHGVNVRLIHIPREVMDKRAVDAGDVHFFELSVASVTTEVSGREAYVVLDDFLPAIDEYMRQKVGDKAAKWSDWIDYWSVDFDHNGETYINQWQSYRTRKDPKLALRSAPHVYAAPGTYQVVVKVIDIFGNDTTQHLAVTVK